MRITRILFMLVIIGFSTPTWSQTSSNFDRYQIESPIEIHLYFNKALTNQPLSSTDYSITPLNPLGTPVTITDVKIHNRDARALIIKLNRPGIDANENYRINLNSVDYQTGNPETFVIIDMRDITKGKFLDLDADRSSKLIAFFPIAPDPADFPSAGAAKVKLNDKKVDAKIVSSGAAGHYVTVTLDDFQFFDKAEVIIEGLKSLTQFIDPISGNRITVPLTIKGKVKREAPDGKDDAKVYIEFAFNKDEGKDKTFSLDTKFGKQMFYAGKGFFISPNMDIRITSEDEGKDEKIQLGASLQYVTLFNRALNGITWDLGGNFEGDKHGNNKNLLGELDMFFYFPGLNGQKKKFDATKKKYDTQQSYGYLHPYAGFEFGSSLADNIPEFNISRFRGRVALNLTRKVDWKRIQVESISAEVDYQFRRTITTEHALINDVAIIIDKGNYHYFEGSASLNFTTLYSAQLTYKNGKTPPKYEKVNQWQANFVIKY